MRDGATAPWSWRVLFSQFRPYASASARGGQTGVGGLRYVALASMSGTIDDR